MLSFDFSDRSVNIVKGDNSGPKIKIERSLTVDVPQDMIVSGEVINILGLRDILLENLKSSQMMDKEAIATFSSSNIVFKELVVPKAKSNEFLNMVQNQMSQEMGISDDYSISYTIVGEAGENNPGSVKVLATACPTNMVESYRNLFKEMQITLTSVNIGCNSISRIVLADKTNLQRMPLLVCQIDDNFLGLILFEKGQMAFARYEPISAEDYESEEYLTEAISENIFRMEQFNKARGGTGLENVILYGKIDDFRKLVDALDSLDVKASVLGVPQQITGYENFEFTIFANAIGALYKRNKQTERINLLEINTSTGKVKQDNSGVLATLLISVGVSVALIAGVTGVIKWQQKKLEEETAQIQAQIDECDIIIAKNQRLHDYLNVINEYQQELDRAINNLETAPLIKKEIFEKIEENLKDTDEKEEIKYESFSYVKSTGTITMSDVELPKQQTANDFIGQILEQDYFANALYNGYKGTDDEGVVIDTVTLKIKDVPDEPEPKEDEAAAAGTEQGVAE
jgi:type IV pilus assembly protein PilM